MSDNIDQTINLEWIDIVKNLLAQLKLKDAEDESYEGDFQFREDFKSIIVVTDDDDDLNHLWEYGSYRTEYAPDSLYRLLWLCRPSKVDFSDMYKTTLFEFTPPDKSCLIQVYLFKYELALYFFAKKEDIEQEWNNGGIISGAPGSSNGFRCKNENTNLFTELVTEAVETIFTIYGGNNFEV